MSTQELELPFQGISLPLEPMKAEACHSRDMIVRLAIATLGKSSQELNELTMSPSRIRDTLDVLEDFQNVAAFMRTAADFVETARARIGLVIVAALKEHPEWAELPGDDEACRPKEVRT